MRFENSLKLGDEVSLSNLAEKHVITGGAITNVVRYCAIKAKQRGDDKAYWQDIQNGIRKEFSKEGKA